MNILPKDIIPISDLVHGANKVINRLKKSKQPLIVTQNGKAAMVCIDVHEYERRFYSEYVVKAIQDAEQDIQKGDVMSLEEFEKELGHI